MVNHRSRTKTTLLVFAVCLLVAVPIAFYGCNGEWARWRAAAIYEQYLDGRHEQAIENLEEIARQLPNDDSIKRRLAEWYLEQDQPQRALDLVNELERRQGEEEIEQLKRLCLMSLGRYSEALALYKQANRKRYFDPAQQIRHLNALAYYRALADEELLQALKDSTSNIEFLESEWNMTTSIPMSANSQAILCAGLLYRDYYSRVLTEDSTNPSREEVAQNAVGMLNEELAQVRKDFVVDFTTLKRETAQDMTVTFPLSTEAQGQLYQRRANLEQSRNALAGLLTLRALIYQDTGLTKRSVLDRLSVEELGFDPQNVFEAFPALDQCSLHLQPLIQYLDTRACVEFKLGLLREAYLDISAAVGGAEAFATVASSLPLAINQESTDLRRREQFYVEGPKRNLAVILFHRSWIYAHLNRRDLAQQDLARIRSLGFVPGNQLF